MGSEAEDLFAKAGSRIRAFPLMVGSVREPRPSDDVAHPPYGMVVTLDVTQVPGLQDLMDRQRAGEVFDVVARWGAAMDESGNHSPLVLIDFFMPKMGVGAEIGIEVDQYPDSVLAGIQTGRVLLLDPKLSRTLQEHDIGSTLAEHRPITLEMPDPSPAIGVLQQRFDLPMGIYAPERRDITPQTSDRELMAFIDGATIVSAAALQYRPDGAPTILLVDSGSEGIDDQIHGAETVEGRWGALSGGKHILLRFDAFADGVPVGRWLLSDPGEKIIRGGASGAHGVAVLSQLPNKDSPQEAERRWQEGLHAWVPHVEVFRTLLAHLYGP